MSEWVERPLEELADFVMGQSPDSATVSELHTGLPFLQGCAEFGQRNPKPKFYVNPPLRIAPKGSTLISVRAPVGTMNQADQSYGIGRGLAAVLGKTRSNQFLQYAICLNVSWLHRRSQGSTFLAIGSDDLRKLPIAVSDDPAICDAATKVIALLDTQIETTEALIAKQERVRAGLMQDLFTRGVDENGQLRPPREQAPHLYHQTELGWLPLGWKVKSFERLVDPNRPISYGILMPGQHVPDGVPVIKVRDIRGGKIMQVGLLRTSKQIDAQYARSRLKENDLLMTIRGTVGRTAIVPLELAGANITQDTARLSITNGFPDFFREFLSSYTASVYLQNNTLGQAVQGINLRDIKSMLAPFPCEAEQVEIAAKLKAHRTFSGLLLSEVEALRHQKAGLMQVLLTGKISVAPLLESPAA